MKVIYFLNKVIYFFIFLNPIIIGIIHFFYEKSSGKLNLIFNEELYIVLFFTIPISSIFFIRKKKIYLNLYGYLISIYFVLVVFKAIITFN